jgi:glycosyltransferase involved in cell wall biosynthesis
MILFSVIIPTYNNADTIERTINCILNQTYSKWEILVIDDGSVDNTKEIVQPFLDAKKIKYFFKKNAGVSSARNNGASKAKGEFLIFLDSDDELHFNTLKNYQQLINNESKVGFISSGFKSPSRQGLPRFAKNISKNKYLNLAGTFAVKREVFEKIGGYDCNLKYSENWEMVARALNYCEINNYSILHLNKYNLIYNLENNSPKNFIRYRNKAHASLYLYKKYYHKGILHFNKNTFLLEAAVNSIKINKVVRARILFKRALKEKFKISTLSRILITYSPLLSKKIWQR